jgi:hypothetical protein
MVCGSDRDEIDRIAGGGAFGIGHISPFEDKEEASPLKSNAAASIGIVRCLLFSIGTDK